MKTKNTNAIGLDSILWDDAALSVWRWREGTTGIVRPTVDGNFAVIELLGAGSKRVVAVFQSLNRARAYNLACGD